MDNVINVDLKLFGWEIELCEVFNEEFVWYEWVRVDDGWDLFDD